MISRIQKRNKPLLLKSSSSKVRTHSTPNFGRRTPEISKKTKLLTEEEEFTQHLLAHIAEVPEFSYLLQHRSLLERNIRKTHRIVYDQFLKTEPRFRPVAELLHTEETYVQHLESLAEVWKPALVKHGFCTQAEVSKFMPDINILLGYNRQFLQIIRKHVECWSDRTSTIGSVFLRFAQFFKSYQNYVNGTDDANRMTRKLKKDSSFKKLEASLMEQCNGLVLEALLITPVQRVPRYSLLLKELIKLTPESHVDYKNLTAALKEIKAVTDSINTKIKDHEAQKTVREVEQHFVEDTVLSDGSKIIAPQRRFIFSGVMIRQDKKDGVVVGDEKKMTFFLFNDALLCAGESGSQLFRKDDYPLDQTFKVVDLPKQVLKNGIEVRGANEGFVVRTDNKAEKENWLHLLRSTHKENMQKLGTFSLPRSSTMHALPHTFSVPTFANKLKRPSRNRCDTAPS